MRTAQRLREHTGGNPLYVRALLTEFPADRWQHLGAGAPGAGCFVTQIVSRLSACSPAARALVEACSVLGVRSSLHMAAALAQLDDPVGALEEAVAVGLLQATDKVEIWDVTFPHPLVQAAVYEHVAPDQSGPAAPSRGRVGRRRRRRAAASGRRRDAAGSPSWPTASTPSPAGRCGWGAWASAASALVEASRLSGDREQREQRLLRAIDAIVSAGDLPQASAFTHDVARSRRARCVTPRWATWRFCAAA